MGSQMAQDAACESRPTEVTGFKRDAAGSVTAAQTSQGEIACEQVVIGAGPWAKHGHVELPSTVSIKGADGQLHSDIPMWIYWHCRRYPGVDPDFLKTDSGDMPPVIHVDSTAPLYSTTDGSLVTDEMWGIYYKPDFHFGGVQGMPHLSR